MLGSLQGSPRSRQGGNIPQDPNSSRRSSETGSQRSSTTDEPLRPRGMVSVGPRVHDETLENYGHQFLRVNIIEVRKKKTDLAKELLDDGIRLPPSSSPSCTGTKLADIKNVAPGSEHPEETSEETEISGIPLTNRTKGKEKPHGPVNLQGPDDQKDLSEEIGAGIDQANRNIDELMAMFGDRSDKDRIHTADIAQNQTSTVTGKCLPLASCWLGLAERARTFCISTSQNLATCLGRTQAAIYGLFS